MIRIRTKLFLFLLVLVVLLNAVAYLLYQNGQRSISEYNQILNRFYLLNAISQQTTDVYEKLNTYLVEQTSDSYESYLEARSDLKH
ncbi:MAG TPA: hypothetical protein VFK27_06290, partial [Bacillales bacterium]|nr:hypothetical protein [Bacillales bacterium]